MADNSTIAELGEEIVSQYSQELIQYYIILASAVIALYDYLLTVSLEASAIWHGKLTVTKGLFYVNRYSWLLCNIINILSIFLKPATNPGHVLFFSVPQILVTVAVNGIFILRTFAIYQRNLFVLIILAVPALGTTTSIIWGTVIQTPFALPRELQIGPNTCFVSDTSSLSARYSGALFDWISTTTFNALVVILTVYRTIRLAMETRRLQMKTSLSCILLRDGIFYYSIIFLPQFVAVGLNAAIIKSGSVTLFSAEEDLALVVNAVEIVMVSRLVLNLSNSANSRGTSTLRNRSNVGPVVFAADSVLGNIGQPLRTGSDDDSDEEGGHVDKTQTGDRIGNEDVEMQAVTENMENIGSTSLLDEDAQVLDVVSEMRRTGLDHGSLSGYTPGENNTGIIGELQVNKLGSMVD